MDKKVVVITGSSRGIGFGLATCFLEEGHNVVISGSTIESTLVAVNKLDKYKNLVVGIPCDVTKKEEVQHLVKEVDKNFSKIDIWINNAGVNHPTTPALELADAEINKVVSINVYGVIHGSRIALDYMVKQGYGALYNMEGLGSEGRIAEGVAFYGMTKRMVRYFTRALAKEYKESNVLICRLSPGMVTTDLLTKDIDVTDDEAKNLKIYNILADKVTDVTPYLTKKILKNKKTGVLIAWLTTPKVISRFVSSPFIKRNPFE